MLNVTDLSCVHMRNLHPGANLLPDANLHPGANLHPLASRSYANKFCPYAPRFYLKFNTRYWVLWRKKLCWNVLSDSYSLSSLRERACVRTCVRAFVCGGGFLDISTAGVRLKRLHSLHIQAESEKAYYSYLTPGAVARSVACKLRKQVLRSILAPGTFFRVK